MDVQAKLGARGRGKIRRTPVRALVRRTLSVHRRLQMRWASPRPPLVRLLMQLSVEDVAARRHVVLDLVCVNRLYRDSTSGATSRIRQTIL